VVERSGIVFPRAELDTSFVLPVQAHGAERTILAAAAKSRRHTAQQWKLESKTDYPAEIPTWGVRK
jgi:hypothetical protein